MATTTKTSVRSKPMTLADLARERGTTGSQTVAFARMDVPALLVAINDADAVHTTADGRQTVTLRINLNPETGVGSVFIVETPKLRAKLDALHLRMPSMGIALKELAKFIVKS